VNALPDSLLRFRGDLEAAISCDLGRRRRRLVRPAALAAAAAAAAGVLAFLLVGGAGPSIVGRAEAALAGGGDSLLHIRMLGSQMNPDGSVVRWEDEEWLVSGAWGPRRQVEKADGRSVEAATTDEGFAQVYDSATNTIYAARALPAPASKQPHPGAEDEIADVPPSTPMEIKRLLFGAGESLRDDGHVSLGSRDAVRLVSENAGLTYLVDADTYFPIELRTKGDGGSVTMRFEVYEQLDATVANRALLSLTAQHPGARVDTDPAHFRAAQARLFPKG
jgi:hypothetical protein